jgi:hypothetical protein
VQLLEDGRLAVGAIVLLIAYALDRHQAAALEARKFPLYRPRPGVNAPDDLRGIEAAFRMAENKAEDPLLNLRE